MVGGGAEGAGACPRHAARRERGRGRGRRAAAAARARLAVRLLPPQDPADRRRARRLPRGARRVSTSPTPGAASYTRTLRDFVATTLSAGTRHIKSIVARKVSVYFPTKDSNFSSPVGNNRVLDEFFCVVFP